MKKHSNDSLVGFKSFLKDVRSLWALVFSGPAILPFIAAFAGISPPWPKQIAPLTAVVVLLALTLTYQISLDSESAKFRKRLAILAVAVIAGMIAYLAISNLFVLTVPTNGERIVLGCGFTNDALLVASQIEGVFGGTCPGDYEKMLSGAQYNAYEIWGKGSIAAITMALLFFWFMFFASFTMFIGTFVISQRKNQTGMRVPRRESVTE